MKELAISAFGGARGWDLYDAELGLWTTSIDNDKAVTETAQANRLRSGPAICMDVRKVEPDPYSFNPSTVLKGSPPCGEFTVAGNGEGRQLLEDLANCVPDVTDRGGTGMYRMRLINADAALVLEPMRLIRHAIAGGRPYRAVVLEQTREVQPVWDAYAEVLTSVGYSVDTGVLRCEQYEVPQTRTRAVLVARRDGEAKLPAPTRPPFTRGSSGSNAEGTPHWVGMAEALGITGPGWSEPNSYLRSNYGTGGVATNRGRRALWQPSYTITRKYNRNKWVLNGEVVGAMTDQQAAVLQTFPADYVWCGKKTEVQLQIGNAIPPLLAKKILECVL